MGFRKVFKLSLTPIIRGEHMNLIRELERVLEREKELEKKREEVLGELSNLKPKRGTLEYKWVKNKVGEKYRYWYLRTYEKGKLRSIYLGAKIPEELLEGIQDRKRAQKLQRELAEIEKELRRIEKAKKEIERALSSLYLL